MVATMKNSNHIRSMFQLIPQRELRSLSNKWQVDKGVRTFSTQQMLYAFVCSQIFHLESLREMSAVFKVPKSTLADALCRRSCGFFEDLCGLLIAQIRKHFKGR